MKTRLLSLLAALTLSVASAPSTAYELRLYTEQFPPFNMSLTGQPFAHRAEDIGGACTDIVKAILAKTSLDYSIRLRNWNYGLSRTQQHPDHAIFCTARTDEREPFFHWVGPLVNIQWALFTMTDNPLRLNSLEDAKNLRIGGYRGDVMTTYLEERGFNVSAIAEDAVNPRRLQLGQVDAWVSDVLAGAYTAAELDIYDIEPRLVFNNTPLFLAINLNTRPEVVQQLYRALEQVRASGEMDSILRAYGHR